MDRSIDLLNFDIESLALSIWGVPRTNLALRQIILTAALRRFPQHLQVITGTVQKIRPRQSVNPLFSPVTFQSLAINLRTTRFNIQKFYMVLTLRLCVLYECHNKHRLLPSTALADWFCITDIESVYCAVRTDSLYTTHVLVFEGLIVLQFGAV